MINRSKLLALVLLAAVFAAGIVTGWAAEAWADDRGREGRRRRGGGGGPDAMVEYLDRELGGLTAAQRDSVRAVFARHKDRMEAIWREVHPRYDSLRQTMRGEISRQLTREQQTRYQALIAASDSARKANGRSR